MDRSNQTFIATAYRRGAEAVMNRQPRATLSQAILAGAYAAAKVRWKLEGETTPTVEPYMNELIAADETLQDAVMAMTDAEGVHVGEVIDSRWSEVSQAALDAAWAARPRAS